MSCRDAYYHSYQNPPSSFYVASFGSQWFLDYYNIYYYNPTLRFIIEPSHIAVQCSDVWSLSRLEPTFLWKHQFELILMKNFPKRKDSIVLWIRNFFGQIWICVEVIFNFSCGIGLFGLTTEYSKKIWWTNRNMNGICKRHILQI